MHHYRKNLKKSYISYSNCSCTKLKRHFLLLTNLENMLRQLTKKNSAISKQLRFKNAIMAPFCTKVTEESLASSLKTVQQNAAKDTVPYVVVFHFRW